MGWDGSGNVVRSDGTRTGSTVWGDARSAGVKILADDHDAHDQDLAEAIQNTLALDGQNSPTEDIDWGGKLITNLGFGTSRTHAARVDHIQDSTPTWGGTSGGSANAQTLDLSPNLNAYKAGQVFRFKAGFTNTGSMTLNINDNGAKSVLTPDGQALAAGDVTKDQVYEVVYDGSSFRLMNTLPAQPTFEKATLTQSGSNPELVVSRSSGAALSLNAQANAVSLGSTADHPLQLRQNNDVIVTIGGTSVVVADRNINHQRTGANPIHTLNRTDGATLSINAQASAASIGTSTNHPLQLRQNDTVQVTLDGSDINASVPYQHNGRNLYAPSWVKYLTGSGGSVAGSQNVSSVTKNGPGNGKYTIAWDTDFANANYCVMVVPFNDTGEFTAIVVAQTAGSVTVELRAIGESGSAPSDPDGFFVSAFGTYA